jgi:inner membrane protein
MNRQAHLVIGVVLFLVYLYVTMFFHGISGELFVSGIVAVAAGSLFPDILEPPTNARHRGFFHSRRAFRSVSMIFLLTAVPVLFDPGIPHFALVFSASCFFLGYASHLLADSQTRAGLPG